MGKRGIAAVGISLLVLGLSAWWLWNSPWLRPEWTWTRSDVQRLHAKGMPAARAFQGSAPYVVEFSQTFSDCRHTLELNPVYHDIPQWISKAKLHGRYEITMYFTAELDYSRGVLVRKSAPRFLVRELTGGTMLPDGSCSLEVASSMHFGLPRWRSLVARGGDLGAVGIVVAPDQPVAAFEAWWQQLRPLETVVYSTNR
jgi:hypothetical protein